MLILVQSLPFKSVSYVYDDSTDYLKNLLFLRPHELFPSELEHLSFLWLKDNVEGGAHVVDQVWEFLWEVNQ